MSTTATKSGWAVRLHDAMDWIFWVAAINALWWLFTVAGAGVFGAAPASAAATALTRRRLRGESVPLLRSFAGIWRREFVHANVVAGPGVWASTLLAFGAAVSVEPWVRTLFLAAFVVAFTNLCVVLPLYAHYDIPLRSYIVVAGGWTLRNIPHVLLLILNAVAVVAISSAIPGVIPFLSMGAWLVVNTALSIGFFISNDQRVAQRSAI